MYVPVPFSRGRDFDGPEATRTPGISSDEARLTNLKMIRLSRERVFVWARESVGEFLSAERKLIFERIALRSAEVDAINNALQDGVKPEELRGAKSSATVVGLRRR